MRQCSDWHIRQFRNWLGRFAPKSDDHSELAYVAKLAEYMGEIPLSKATKAVLSDFYMEQLRSTVKSGGTAKVLRARIYLDGFYSDFRREGKQAAK